MTQRVVRNELRRRTDWKYCDHSSSGSAVSATGTITSLYANLVRGDAGYNNFNGNDIRPQAITFKYYCATTQTYNSFRVMVFQWFDAATPAVTGVLESNATGLGTISPVLITNKRYIKVLYDKTHVMAPTAGGDTTVTGSGTVDAQTVYIPGKRLKPTRYNSTTNSCQDGNLYVLVISDDLAPSYPLIYWYSRVTFSDN